MRKSHLRLVEIAQASEVIEEDPKQAWQNVWPLPQPPSVMEMYGAALSMLEILVGRYGAQEISHEEMKQVDSAPRRLRMCADADVLRLKNMEA